MKNWSIVEQQCPHCKRTFEFYPGKIKTHLELKDKNKLPPKFNDEDWVDVFNCPFCNKDIILRQHESPGKDYCRNKIVFCEDEFMTGEFGKNTITLFKKKMEFVTRSFVTEYKRRNKRYGRTHTWFVKTIVDFKNNVEVVLDTWR